MYMVTDMDYVEQAIETYTALKESGAVDQSDVADLTMAIIQEEAKDRRTEVMNQAKDARVAQMHEDRVQEQSQQKEKDWREDPATDAQKKALDNLGVDYDDDISKGEASNRIDEAKSQQSTAQEA